MFAAGADRDANRHGIEGEEREERRARQGAPVSAAGAAGHRCLREGRASGLSRPLLRGCSLGSAERGLACVCLALRCVCFRCVSAPGVDHVAHRRCRKVQRGEEDHLGTLARFRSVRLFKLWPVTNHGKCAVPPTRSTGALQAQYRLATPSTGLRMTKRHCGNTPHAKARTVQRAMYEMQRINGWRTAGKQPTTVVTARYHATVVQQCSCALAAGRSCARRGTRQHS